MNQPLKFKNRFEVQANALLIHYGVENQSNLDVYLLNRVHNLRYEISPDFIYIELDRQKSLVSAYKKVPDIPQGMNPSMPIAPFVTPVRTGTYFMETVHIPLPVHEYLAYPRAAPAQQGQYPYIFHFVRFYVQYYWSTPGMKERSDLVNGTPVVIPVTPPGKRLNLDILASDTTPLNLPVVEGST